MATRGFFFFSELSAPELVPRFVSPLANAASPATSCVSTSRCPPFPSPVVFGTNAMSPHARPGSRKYVWCVPPTTSCLCTLSKQGTSMRRFGNVAAAYPAV